MTLRKEDYKSEIAVADFLDQYFYPVYTTNKKRLKSQANQFKGLDVKCDYFGKEILIDEKAAAHYVNKDLPTFAFELDFIARNKEVHQGWFYDDQKETAYYLLSWIWAKQEKDFSVEDITKLEVVLIERSAIQAMLSNHGLTKEKAELVSKHLRTKQQFGLSGKRKGNPFYFYFTKHLAEKPINIIIHKSELIKLSTLHLIIEPKN